MIPSGSEKEIVINIEDHLAATMVKNQGLVQIGSEVYKIGYDKAINFSRYVSGIESNQYATSDPAKGITVSSIKRKIYPLNPKARALDEINNLSEYWVGSSKRRLVGTVYDWDASTLYNVHIGMQTKHQRRFLGAWFAEDLSSIGLYSYGYYRTFTNGIPVGSSTYFNTGWQVIAGSYYNYTLQYGGSNTYAFDNVYCWHYGFGNDGEWKNIIFQ